MRRRRRGRRRRRWRRRWRSLGLLGRWLILRWWRWHGGRAAKRSCLIRVPLVIVHRAAAMPKLQSPPLLFLLHALLLLSEPPPYLLCLTSLSLLPGSIQCGLPLCILIPGPLRLQPALLFNLEFSLRPPPSLSLGPLLFPFPAPALLHDLHNPVPLHLFLSFAPGQRRCAMTPRRCPSESWSGVLLFFLKPSRASTDEALGAPPPFLRHRAADRERGERGGGGHHRKQKWRCCPHLPR
mmetsp:Transcript_107440/g.269493  ORF Transcript_107440/g.269493 Transcript_107440/m.269493 type:complete len:238 (+) Transcript_107440:180-893(+)